MGGGLLITRATHHIMVAIQKTALSVKMIASHSNRYVSIPKPLANIPLILFHVALRLSIPLPSRDVPGGQCRKISIQHLRHFRCKTCQTFHKNHPIQKHSHKMQRLFRNNSKTSTNFRKTRTLKTFNKSKTLKKKERKFRKNTTAQKIQLGKPALSTTPI